MAPLVPAHDPLVAHRVAAFGSQRLMRTTNAEIPEIIESIRKVINDSWETIDRADALMRAMGIVQSQSPPSCSRADEVIE